MLPLLLAQLGCVGASVEAPSADTLGATSVTSTADTLPEIVHVDDFDPADLAPGQVPPILINTPKDSEAGRIACASSCSAPDPADHDTLDAALIPHILEEWNTQPVGEPTMELETLLFYLHDTQDFIADNGLPGLDAEHAAFLTRELARDTVTMEMRLLDDTGAIATYLPERDFPLWEKQHLNFQGTGSLGHLETGGKAKRVGLAHLWTRW